MQELLLLGNTPGKSWDFLAHAQGATQYFAQFPALRFLFAANLAQVRVPELALEQLVALGHDAQTHPDVVALRTAIEAIAPSRPTPIAWTSACARVEAALGMRMPVVLRAALRELSERSPGSNSAGNFDGQPCDVFLASDGNLILREAANPETNPSTTTWQDPTNWAALADVTHAIAPWVPKRQGGTNPEIGFAFPVVVDGALPPCVLARVWHATSKPYLGHTPRIYCVNTSAWECAIGLAILAMDTRVGKARETSLNLDDSCERGALLSDPRVVFLVGPEAQAQLRSALTEHIEVAMPLTVVTAPLCKAHTQAALIVQEARTLQSNARGEIAEALTAQAASRTSAYWKERLLDALSPTSNQAIHDNTIIPHERRRILIPTSRYTTYLQHAAQGLAVAFEHAGFDAFVSIEPDMHSVFDPLARLKAMHDVNPDIVVRMNSPRMHGVDAGLELAMRVPTVCWVQDAMPHLFDHELAQSMGPMDVLVGCRVPELVRSFGYPAERSGAMPVVADESRFGAKSFLHERAHERAREVAREVMAGAQRDDLTCEIAYASHHAKTPLELHHKIVRESPPEVGPILERVYPFALAYAKDPFGLPLKAWLRERVRDALRDEMGIEPDAATVAKVHNSYALAIADRALRHEVLGWAAMIAEARGWRFSIFGIGWDTHPTLARYAKPALAHDTDLALSYAQAKVHLHMSHHGPLHQRVFECALSGGLPCVLVTPSFISSLVAWSNCEALETTHSNSAASGIQVGTPVANHWASLASCAAMQRLGVTDHPWYPREGKAVYAFPKDRIADTESAAGDLTLALCESAFRDSASLERVVERACESTSNWRSSASSAISTRVRARLTHAALVDLVRTLMRGAIEAT